MKMNPTVGDGRFEHVPVGGVDGARRVQLRRAAHAPHSSKQQVLCATANTFFSSCKTYSLLFSCVFLLLYYVF